MLYKRIVKNFSTLVLAQHNGKTISKNTLKLLSAADKLKQQTHLLFIGKQLNPIVQASKQLLNNSINKIITAKCEHPLAENVEQITSALIEKYKYNNIIGLASSYGKDCLPRIAGKYGVQPITDIVEVIDNKTFVRPIYAGNALSKVKTSQKINLLSFRPASFQQIKPSENNPQIEQFDCSSLPATLTSFVSQQISESNRPQLTTARIVISGGRGVKSKQNFPIIEKLAEAFGDAAVGASRAAVDAGYCPNQLQVGQTGKVVAPELYIAVGISGAVQHLAGMKDSKVIVAINTNPGEAIFEIATYGLQGDLFKVLPQLTQKVKKIKSG